tara:strand:- start:71 stop:331 length:261 start_codon:yes stop_codon:yes gene_type:complete
MATQKHMGRYDLIERLSAQVGNKDTAIEILKNRGHLNKDGKYTVEGMKRNAMTAEERAKDRASKKTGKSKSEFKYNPKTNRVKLKG